MTDTANEGERPDPSRLIAQALRNDPAVLSVTEDEPELTKNALTVLDRRYLAKDRDGNIVENQDGMFRRVARDLSLADLDYGDTEKERQQTEDEFYRAMRRLDVMPNSPTLMNAGRELQQLSACFVLPVEDSLDSIFDQVKRTALIHKSGGGTGFSFTRIRPAGDVVGSTGGVASGPVSFIRAFDTATDVVKQGGTRRGANMGILNVDHPDIMAFIESKRDGKNLSNFNISVAATGEFMAKLKTGERYNLVNPRTGEKTGTLDAREVFGRIAEMAWETGDPGLVFLDPINRDNPNPKLGRIESTNPCVTGDTLIFTDEGLRRADAIWWSGKPVRVVVDQRMGGGIRQASQVIQSGVKPVFQMTTKEGYELKLTADHKVMTTKGWVEARHLVEGDRIHVLDREPYRYSKSDYGNKHDILKGKELASRLISANETNSQSEAATAIHENPDIEGILTQIMGQNQATIDGFVGYIKDQTSVCKKEPKWNTPGLLLKLQILELNNNIESFIEQDDGMYRLAAGHNPWRKEAPFTATFASLVSAGKEMVYDLTEPDTQSFVANGIVVHNCGEQPLLPYESCNLASVNLARMVRYPEDGPVEIDWDRLDQVVKTTVHMLDNVIDRNNYPIPEIGEMSRATRRIGLGVMGFSDLLVQLGISYDSEEGIQTAREVMKRVSEKTHEASSELATRRGVYPAWEESIYDPPAGSGTEPVRMRNSAPTTIAPTGTISIIAGASSGIEPLFALSYVRNVMDNTRLIEGNPHFEAAARHAGIYSEDLMEELAKSGSLSGLEPRFGVPEWMKQVFRTSHDISPEWHVRMQAAFQEHTDNSVSKTINFPSSASVEDVARAYTLAYELGCKGITVYRDGSKEGQVLSTGETGADTQDTGGALATRETAVNGRQNGARYEVPRERPNMVTGVTERVRTGHGNIYVTINKDEENRPFEIFGNLGKAGGCDSAQMEALSRMISMALRARIDPGVIVEQLLGITCCPAWDGGVMVRSSPDAVALALKRHSGTEADAAPGENGMQIAMLEGNGLRPEGPQQLHARKCPDCNGPVIFQEGRVSCTGCGWNKRE